MEDKFLEFLMIAVQYRQDRLTFEDCRLKLAASITQMTREDIDDLTHLLRPHYSNLYRESATP